MTEARREQMIRIIYRWQVARDDFAAFQESWEATTNAIHRDVPGALGSFMLREPELPENVLTVARWASIEHWKAFWDDADPEAMKRMRELGTRIAVDVYDEVDDFTRDV
ncbi:MAG: antibiotic biosynthesis monooxygenase [Pseudomonadota bacterium]